MYITKINEKGCVALEDTILYKGVPATAGSKMLETFVPLHNAEVADRLEKAGFVISGKVNVGEFGFDLLGETSFKGGETDEKGNLASASSKLVKEGVKAVLAVELNGAGVRGAALGGTVFVKPTYGTVSRYGVIPCACSSEQVGVHAANVKDAVEVLTAISGHDAKDGTSLPAEKYDYSFEKDVKGMKVCVPAEYVEKVSDDAKNKIDDAVKKLKDGGAEVEFVSFAEYESVQPAWFIMMCAESCNNLSRYEGVKFGYRTAEYNDIEELYTKSRTEAFGLLTKSVILYGSDVLSKNRYFSAYDKSLKIRRAVRNSLDGLFAKYDLVLAPAASQTEYKFADMKTVYNESYFTSLGIMMGLPTVAASGVQLLGNSFSEKKLFAAAMELTEVE